MTRDRTDVVVIGAGIAGASAAAALADTLNVILLEREDFPGRHSTGRSAALFSAIYGGAAIRALSRASRDFLFAPPSGFAPAPLVRPRSTLHIASSSQLSALDAFCAVPDVQGAVERKTPGEARALCTILREDYIAASALDLGSADVEVDLLHQAWLRQIKLKGGRVLVNQEVSGLERRRFGWTVRTPTQEIETAVVVNAAGAWADEIATLAGANLIGLEPKRRTALIVDAPEGRSSEAWPMVIDVEEQFYFRPEAGGLMMSPADETPSPPCDAQPDEWDIAVAIDRIEIATNLQVRSVRRSWAGLRSFVEDRNPVVGYAPDADGFFWLAGQGGYGIQTSPAMGQLAAALIERRDLPDSLARFGVDPCALSPKRLRSRTTRSVRAAP